MAEHLHPVELELAAAQSLEAISSLTREEAIAEAAYLCTLEWVRAARREGTLEVLVLGRFDLAGEQPWPSLGLLVTRREDRRRGVRAKAAMLFLYLDEAGQWAVNERLGPPNGVPSVPWTYYAGVLSGPPSTLNGEWPRVTGLEPRGSGSGPATAVAGSGFGSASAASASALSRTGSTTTSTGTGSGSDSGSRFNGSGGSASSAAAASASAWTGTGTGSGSGSGSGESGPATTVAGTGSGSGSGRSSVVAGSGSSGSSGSDGPGESGSSAAAAASARTAASLLARLRARLGSILRRKENRASPTGDARPRDPP